MAKKKSIPIEPELIEEEVIAEVEEEIEEVEAEPEVPVIVEKADNADQWYFTQLKVINNMTDKAKARRLAARITKHRKGI